ncbi:MAG: hypothetical protein V4572_11470 [Bacteroidota bacterium]
MKNPSEYGKIITDIYQKAQNDSAYLKELYENPVKIFSDSGLPFQEENNPELIFFVRKNLDLIGSSSPQRLSCETCKTIAYTVMIGTAGLAYLLTSAVTISNPLVIAFTASLSVALGVTLSVASVVALLNALIASGTVAFSLIANDICGLAGYC